MERFEVSDYSSYSEAGSSSETSDEESGSSSSSDSERKGTKRKRSETEGHTPLSQAQAPGLALSQLYMMKGEDDKEDDSCYAKRGKDPARVREALKQPCCKAQCKRILTFKLLIRMVTIFWSMSKASQDCVLWAMQQQGARDFDSDSDSSSSSTHHQISWSIEGLLPTLIKPQLFSPSTMV